MAGLAVIVVIALVIAVYTGQRYVAARELASAVDNELAQGRSLLFRASAADLAAEQVIANAKVLAEDLQRTGFSLERYRLLLLKNCLNLRQSAVSHLKEARTLRRIGLRGAERRNLRGQRSTGSERCYVIGCFNDRAEARGAAPKPEGVSRPAELCHRWLKHRADA